MSETVTTSVAKPIVEPLITPTFILAIYALTILAGALAGVFLIRDMTPLQGTIAGSVVSGILTGVLGFYFGSSKGSQAKDAAKFTPITVTTPEAKP